MLFETKGVRLFIRPGVTDLRKGTNGLTMLIEQEMGKNPLDKNLYLFCNRERKLVKAVLWEETGFWLCQKRLEQGKYPWVENSESVRELSEEELLMLLSGIDFFKAHKEVKYNRVS